MEPFRIFSWQRPFLPALKEFIYEKSGGHPGRALLITPNRRPWRYLSALYKTDKKAGVLPKMLAVNDMVVKWSAMIAPGALHSANLLDQVALLWECVGEAGQTSGVLAHHFANMDAGTFLPWGIRLANILDEFYREGIMPASVENLEGELSAPAAALMESMGAIDRLYRQKLTERSWTTTGMDHFSVMRSLPQIPSFFRPGEERPVIIAGFYILSGSHEQIFKTLWEAGAHVCLHTDPAVAGAGKVHWSCSAHLPWIKKWKTRAELWAGENSVDLPAPKYHFFSGFDFHSQLEEMATVLKGADTASTAVILGKDDTLMPTLHNLPIKDVNISMGYPLDRTPIFRLIDDTIAMHENRFGDNSFMAEDALKIIRHPYFNRLRPKAGDSSVSIAKLARGLDHEIRSAGRHWQPPDLSLAENADTPERLLQNALWHFFELPKTIDTPASFARAIDRVCMFLVEYGGKSWQWRNPLDAEVMYRIFHNALPALRHNSLAAANFPLATLHTMFTELARSERIPFEADPVEGLQIMGLLESRLLQFDRVLILDATDDVLPGNPAQDPLMPDSLRSLFGLPDGRRREKTAGYNLNRLCQGAKEVYLMWQEGSGSADFIGGKKIRSRFVEEHIWNEEQARPELLDMKNGPVKAPMPPLRISEKRPILIPAGATLQEAINQYCASPIAPTGLDSYLACPVQFLWSKIMALDENDKSPESAAMLTGTFVHKILEDFYRSVGSRVNHAELLKNNFEAKIGDIFEKVATDMRLAAMIDYDAYLNLKKTVPARLQEYMANQPDNLEILGMENKLEACVSLNCGQVRLKGKIDRIDNRDGYVHVLDYKTGRDLPKNDPSIWNDTEFFSQVGQACQTGNRDLIMDLFEQFRERVQSLQLPIYLLLLENSPFLQAGRKIGNAAWIQLRKQGKETTLFADLEGDEMEDAIENCKNAVALVLEHMRLAPQFIAEDSKTCERCGFTGLCFS